MKRLLCLGLLALAGCSTAQAEPVLDTVLPQDTVATASSFVVDLSTLERTEFEFDTFEVVAENPVVVEPEPAPTPAPTPAPVENTPTPAPTPAPAVDHKLHVWTRGTQAHIDMCRGAVDYTEVTDWIGRPYIAEHQHCGGAHILSWAHGDTVQITGLHAGLYEVVVAKNAPYGSYDDVLPSGGQVLVQTCWPNQSGYRIVGLNRIG